MIALLVLFDLKASFGTLGELRAYVAGKSVPRYRQVDGLRMKIFLSDEAGNATGALYLWESEAALDAYLPQIGESSIQRWGIVPSIRRFEVEAIAEGRHDSPDLARVGHAMAPARS